MQFTQLLQQEEKEVADSLDGSSINDEFGESIESRTHESKLYPMAEVFLQGLIWSEEKIIYETLVLGVKRRLQGQWNTPDIIGWRVIPLEITGGAEIELVSLEVKWALSKDAVAEANSHQKIAHKSYLLTTETIEQIQSKQHLIEDAACKGIGLICKQGDSYICILPARDNQVQSSKINAFLMDVLSQEQIKLIRQKFAASIRLDIAAALREVGQILIGN